ncbi:MAG: hypothetical protein ACRD3S_00480, partial [Terracidiphilus sp.]
MVHKTLRRRVVTMEHGALVVREVVRRCAHRCKHPNGEYVTLRPLVLARHVAPGAIYGYDLEVYIGLQRFLRYRQRDEIQTDLQREHGLTVSSGQISILEKRFVNHLEALHWQRQPALASALAEDGGYPMHIDSTGEDGRGTLFVAYAGWRLWALGAWKLSTERADLMLPHLRTVVAAFGTPCAIMRDFGQAVIQAATDLVDDFEKPVAILGCHSHFLKDVGKDLLEASYNELRNLFRRYGITSGLRALARDLGRRLGGILDPVRLDVAAWLGAVPDHTFPAGRTGLATVRAVAQWALDYPQDGSHLGFPYDRPYLDLFQRCRIVHRAVEAFIETAPQKDRVRQAVQRLARVVGPVVSDSS